MSPVQTPPAEAVLSWLLEGDPSIRWQVLRDLTDAPQAKWEPERALVATSGWSRQLLDHQEPDGRWASDRGPTAYAGLYSPKWISTTYSMILLRRLGLPPENASGHAGCAALVERSQWLEDGSIAPWSSPRTDVCVCAMILALLEYFDFDAPQRREGLLRFLLANQKDDGGWNCRPKSNVSSMHTTLSTLEALQLCRGGRRNSQIEAAMQRGHEYLLRRRLFRSLRTGEVIREDFRRFSFPPRWFYDVLRALDHLRTARPEPDGRLDEALALLRSKRRKDGTWPLQNRRSGETYFEMETPGKPSRWNTLRALRVLRSRLVAH